MDNQHLPPDNDSVDESLLLVLLTTLSDVDKDKLIDHVQPPASNFKIHTWSPNDLLPSIAPQGQYIDSQANLYALAIHLYRTGRSFFVVADSLSKRQLQGRPVRGESGDISVILIAVRPTGRDSEVRVLAKRSAMTRDENVNLLAVAKSFEVSQKFLSNRRQCIPEIYSDFGLQLHDPDHGIFNGDSLQLLGHEKIYKDVAEELKNSINLPMEVALEISSRANVTRSQSLIHIPPGSDLRPYQPFIHIFLSFRTSDEELRKMQVGFQASVKVEYKAQAEKRREERLGKKMEGDDYYEHYDVIHNPRLRAFVLEPTVCLIPWDYDHSPTRRDVIRMRATTADHPTMMSGLLDIRARPVDLLLHPVKDGNFSEAEFATVYPAPCGLVVTRNTLSNLVQELGLENKTAKFTEFEGDLHQFGFIDSEKLEILPSAEIMSSYDDPFYPNPPPWQPIDHSMNSISLFYMTNKLTEQQDRALHNEIQSMKDVDEERWGEKIICSVPWKQDEGNAEDATLEYMVEVLENVQASTYVQTPYFFADEQSGVDQTIIVMEEDLFFAEDDDEKAKELLKDVPDPEVRGVRYARIRGRDAHTVFANLSISNMDMEDFGLEGDGILTFPRAGWPGHGILFNREELEEQG